MADETIDRYQIKEKIGAGGMGTVYRAWDSEIERDVALKWLPAYFSADVTFTERFKREARVVARLEHPHIVPIYDVGESEGRPFIIMRLLNGGTLREQTEKPDFDLTALVKAMEQIGDALTAAHARQIIHRDIKPGNILFDDNGSAFLSDFGIAKVLDSATQLTGSGFIGTPAYMSPEQFIGQGVDGRSDQYSLAIVLYESLTGSLPFKGNTAQMMYKHINAVPPEINFSDYSIPEDLNPVLQKALSKNPNERYARIQDFVTAMNIAVRHSPDAGATLLPLAAGVMIATPNKPATAPTALNTPAEPQTDQLQKDYRDALEAMSREQWAVAVAAFDRVLQISPDYGNAVEFKQQAQAKLTSAAPPEGDETSLDIPSVAVFAAGAAAAGAVLGPAHPGTAPADPSQTAAKLSAADATEVEFDESDLGKTSLDLPPGAAVALAAAAAGDGTAVPAFGKTSLDLPPAAAAVPPTAAAVPEEKRNGFPLWAIAVAVILLLLLCGGSAYAGINYFGGGAGEETVAQEPANTVGGSSDVAFGAAGTNPAGGDEVQAAAPTDTAEAPATDTPLPQPTAAPIEEPTAVPVLSEPTALPPTATEAPTETPLPQLPTARVTVASANLRRGPGTIYPVLGPIFRDDLAIVLAKNNDGSWYNVQLEDGSLAWLAASVVELVNEASASEVAVAATVPVAPTRTPVPPTLTPIPIPPTQVPPSSGGGGNSGGGGGNSGGGGGGGGSYTPEAP